LVTDLHVWDKQVSELKEKYNLLTYDQRGHGGSTLYQTGFDMNQLGNDLIALCEALNIDKITYVGLSMGVPTGLSAYSKKPNLFKRLVFADGLCKSTPISAQAWEDRITFVKDQGIEAFATDTIQRWFSSDSIKQGISDPVYGMMKSTSSDGFVDCAKALQNFNYEEVLLTIKVPTLLIAGGNDGNMPNSVRTMSQAIKGASFHVVDGAGHIPNVEQSKQFNALLTNFLEV
jgi:3-oxoadipate enol-lactonase